MKRERKKTNDGYLLAYLLCLKMVEDVAPKCCKIVLRYGQQKGGKKNNPDQFIVWGSQGNSSKVSYNKRRNQFNDIRKVIIWFCLLN